MSSEFEKIRQDVLDFNARIKSWNESDLEDHEVDEVNTLLEDTINLIAGQDDSGDEDDNEPDTLFGEDN